jgi:hypothetical protein
MACIKAPEGNFYKFLAMQTSGEKIKETCTFCVYGES